MNILKELQKMCIKFRNDRDWKQFHSRRNLAESIVLESSELLELFQWDKRPKNNDISEEIADIMIYLLTLAHDSDIDIVMAIMNKLSINEGKYPIAKFKGSNKKYNEKQTRSN